MVTHGEQYREPIDKKEKNIHLLCTPEGTIEPAPWSSIAKMTL